MGVLFGQRKMKTPENPSAESTRITQDGTGNKLAYLDGYAYFLNNLKKIGPWSKNDFLITIFLAFNWLFVVSIKA